MAMAAARVSATLRSRTRRSCACRRRRSTSRHISAVFAFFGEFDPDKELEKHFTVVEHILAMLEVSRSIAFLSFWAFAKVHGPYVPFVEGLMKARGDFDRTSVDEAMEAVKCKVKEEGLMDRICL